MLKEQRQRFRKPISAKLALQRVKVGFRDVPFHHLVAELHPYLNLLKILGDEAELVQRRNLRVRIDQMAQDAAVHGERSAGIRWLAELGLEITISVVHAQRTLLGRKSSSSTDFEEGAGIGVWGLQVKDPVLGTDADHTRLQRCDVSLPAHQDATVVAKEAVTKGRDIVVGEIRLVGRQKHLEVLDTAVDELPVGDGPTRSWRRQLQSVSNARRCPRSDLGWANSSAFATSLAEFRTRRNSSIRIVSMLRAQR
ncbi:hypothetical protein F4821DRAFT_230562 [Hypoxylon rubiginosum]|uniref:Uncharacterized protein n=1 Tax=Hypoxylon rubiginosum TaxID=110542 RepID=A0ACC0DAI2_9PEZI|nr:hypothetical protein F4821DRAFT_230562 [Hypoxylon rubiginosum]